VLLDPAQTGDFATELAEATRQEQVPPWCSYVGWLGEVPVAMGGFKGAPGDTGLVEIGYLTFASQQGRGYASALAGFLVDLARREGATGIVAHTLCEPNASTRVLEKAGFVRDGFGHDDDVGEVWRWSRGA
jgi:RimJ/RimL family protein N-acetyltransferase